MTLLNSSRVRRATTSGNFLLRKGVLRSLDDPPGSARTGHFSVNNRGDTVGAYSDADGTPHGFLRDKRAQFETIEVAGASQTIPLGINDRGETVIPEPTVRLGYQVAVQ
jgi:hypothetical protein